MIDVVGRTCPCLSGAPFDACCGPYLRGESWPPTAEVLMRSRYSAFAGGNADHLFRTWHPRTRPDDVSPDPDCVWTGLEILATRDGGLDDETGEVEFVATWRSGKQSGELHETSRFARRAGRWLYLDGDVAD